MYCPRCGGEFRDGYARCSDCDVDLVAALPATEHDANLLLVPIFETSDVNLVAILKSVFEDAGIAFDTRNEALQDLIYGRMAGFNPVVGPIEFWVREDDENAARQLIAETLQEPVTPSAANDERSSVTTQTSPKRRRWLRAIGAVTLNICVLPLFYMSTGLILGKTAWGERHLSSAMWAGLAIAVVFATVTCIAWLTRPKFAAWLQVLPLILILGNFIAQRSQESDGTGSFDRLRDQALLIIATFFAALGLLAIASAVLPRLIGRSTRR